ncbi:RNA-directed DNA polymerase, eukaryota, Reverse transcriptase zinc-binding domain protein [Artemisia annua]|uniref:RNA-directed DNA polymerase, eukaryota, Reverse transcriptase zinc-binding domain protein n=1 Tax=Artemisia annua TaxID=35608 RepID=A0A2U1Q9S9_ARTAN|nr:RNA-directed DNA polymerase, eukaryota, Reverse transcriptase zinc-binding domain protein [Artemisia annua]
MQVRVLSGMDAVPPSLDDALTFLIPISKGYSVTSIISRLLLAATTYYLWMERNSRLFMRKKSTVAEVVQVIVSTVRLKMVTFKFKKITHRPRLLLDQWKIPSACLIHEGSIGKLPGSPCTSFASGWMRDVRLLQDFSCYYT